MKIALHHFTGLACRRICLLAIFSLSGVFAVGSFGIIELGETLLVPERRVPGDWQNAVLNEPARHGVVTERFSTIGGDGISIQALLIRPSVKPGTSVRYCEMRRRLGRRFASSAGEGDAANCAPVWGTVFLLHGRSGIKEDGVTIAERFAAAGLATILFDSRAHGESPASTMSYGVREVPDLGLLIDAVESRYNGEGDAGAVPLMVFGNSMGAAVTVQALPIEPRLRAAVLVSPFASLSDLTGEMLERRLPMGEGIVRRAVATYARAHAGLILDTIRPEQAAVAIDVPTMTVHGDCDEVIPIEHGKKLFDAIGDDRKIWRCVPGAQHGNVLLKGGDDLYEEIVRFFRVAVDAECRPANFVEQQKVR